MVNGNGDGTPSKNACPAGTGFYSISDTTATTINNYKRFI